MNKVKSLVLATAVAVSTTVSALTIDDLMNDSKLALTALGVANYYSQNCAGLTSRGKNAMLQAFYIHGFNEWNPVDIAYSEEFKLGYDTSEKYTCNSLRDVLTDAGAGPLIR
jgi:hypothetical protein